MPEHLTPAHTLGPPRKASTGSYETSSYCSIRSSGRRNTSVYVCVTFVAFTSCESCTTPISTNTVSVEAGEYGLTRGTCFSCAVPTWSRSPGCGRFMVCFGWGGFLVVLQVIKFQIHAPRAVSVDSVKRLRQLDNLPTENSRPPIPTRCTVYCAPT